MGFFDGMVDEIQSIFESDSTRKQNKAQSALNIKKSDEWVEWHHSGTKVAETNAEKLANIALTAVTSHCAKCLNLGGCRFMIKKNARATSAPKLSLYGEPSLIFLTGWMVYPYGN